MSFQPIKRLIPNSLERAGWKPQIDAMRVLETAKTVLIALWGEDKASRVAFVSVKDGCLKATSASGAAIQELKIMETRFLNEVNRLLGERRVFSLKAGRF